MDRSAKEEPSFRPTSPPPPPPPPAKGNSTVVHDEDERLFPVLDPVSNPKEKEQSCSSSMSDSDSDPDSDDDFFQIEATELARPIPPALDPVIDFIPRDLKKSMERSPSANRIGEKPSGGEERLSPAVQVMTRGNGVPDPSRIPSSVFERSSATTPLEWSVTSNESLFSIHMGNSSFSRDRAILMGKSGDLGFQGVDLMDLLSPLPPPPPAVNSPVECRMTSKRREAMDLRGEVMEAAAASVNAEAMRDVMRAAAEGKEKEKQKPPLEPLMVRSVSRHSDGSTNSFSSFAFPILTGDGRTVSTKVDFGHHTDHQPQSPMVMPRAVQSQHAASTAKVAENQSTGPTPVQNRLFPCFSCCAFCC